MIAVRKTMNICIQYIQICFTEELWIIHEIKIKSNNRIIYYNRTVQQYIFL